MLLRQYLRKYNLIRCAEFTCASLVVLVVIYHKSYPTLSDDTQFNSSCHYVIDKDALKLLDDNFHVPKDSIFFIETSCRCELNSRQACSIESAARTNSQTQINVVFCGPLTESALLKISHRNLLNFNNVKFSRIHVETFSKITPIAYMIKRNFIDNRNYSMQNLANILRYAILYKWGGIYIDTDVIVAKRLKYLSPNWAAKEADHEVISAVLALSTDKIGKRFIEDIFEELQTNYQPDNIAWNGPLLLTRVLAKKWCIGKNRTEWSASNCRGFYIYDRKLIYPMNNRSIFDQDTQDLIDPNDAFTYHMSGHLNVYKKLISSDSLYRKLAQKYCPTIYKYYGENFGT